IPIAIAHEWKEESSRQTQSSQQQPSTTAESGQSEEPKSESDAAPKSLGSVLLKLAFLGLASPFLELQNPVYGLIGLVILFVGIRIAWRLTQGRSAAIHGPFDNAAAASV
ncbi:MAG TPA: hypothetical protein VFP71_04205, partial [Candidatus Angelobacter sp.]|nr:hypothetical protein [Candidatus Angelobacter sp.]